MSIEGHEMKLTALWSTVYSNLHHSADIEEVLDLLAECAVGPTDTACRARVLLKKIGYYAAKECEERLRVYEEKHPNARAEEERKAREWQDID